MIRDFLNTLFNNMNPVSDKGLDSWRLDQFDWDLSDSGPGSQNYDSLVKSVATSANRVGRARYNDFFLYDENADNKDLILAEEKIVQAHKLLLGAHSILSEYK